MHLREQEAQGVLAKVAAVGEAVGGQRCGRWTTAGRAWGGGQKAIGAGQPVTGHQAIAQRGAYHGQKHGRMLMRLCTCVSSTLDARLLCMPSSLSGGSHVCCIPLPRAWHSACGVCSSGRESSNLHPEAAAPALLLSHLRVARRLTSSAMSSARSPFDSGFVAVAARAWHAPDTRIFVHFDC